MTGKKLKKLGEGFKASFENLRTSSSTLTISIFSFVFLILGSDPQYTLQILSFNPLYIVEAVKVLASNTLRTSGTIGLSLITAYSVLIGISATNFYLRVKNTGFADLKQVSSILPGFLVAGCAGCGVGLLSFIGFAGVVASLPLDGNLVRIGGIILMLAVITSIGDPKTCSISES